MIVKKPPPILVMNRGERVKVDFAIKLDRQALRIAVEIEYVIADAMLPSEFTSVEFRTLQHSPKSRLGRCQIFAKFSPELLQIRPAVRPLVPRKLSFLSSRKWF